MMKPESNATITNGGSETTVLTRGKSQGRVMSLVNRRGSQKLDFLRKPGDINNKIF